jgi:hypothetical protein
MVDAHPILFRGLTFDTGSGLPRHSTEGRPVLVERTDDDFIAALLDELNSDDGRKLLARTVLNAGEQKQGLKLYQPVHRSFHLSIFEASCDAFGEPRLDAAKIDSAGLVVRRFNPASGRREGWMKLGGEVRGWMPLADARELDRDPDPTRREEPFPAGHPEINTLLKNALGAPQPYEESVSLLFVAPPHVCAAARRTILYGLVPVASSELVSTKMRSEPRYEEDELRGLLAPYFRDPQGIRLGGIGGKSYSPRYAEELLRDSSFVGSAEKEAARKQAEQQLDQFATMVRMLVSVFNAFEHKELRAALNQVQLDNGKRLGDSLAEAAQVFAIEQEDRLYRMPKTWPLLSDRTFTEVVRAAAKASSTRLSTLVPRQGRFDVPGARYEARGFIRVKRDDGCPPKLVWSAPSQPFQIASWYENGKLPPVQVALPPVTRNNVSSFLPNVAFQVPKNIFDMISRNKPKDFLEQKAKEGRSIGVDWICGFNIPIITLCAFIVLSIFLALLNIIFWWLPFIKICFPLPRRSSSS